MHTAMKTGIVGATLESFPTFENLDAFGQTTWQAPDYKFITNLREGRFAKRYDSSLPISREEYRQAYTVRAVNSWIDNRGKRLSSAGLAAGAAAIFGNAALKTVALPLSIALDAALLGHEAMMALGKPYAEDRDFGQYISYESQLKTAGGFDKDSGIDASRYISSLASRPDIKTLVGNKTDVQNLIADSMDAGVFTYSRGAEDFSRKAKEMVENFRTIQHAMRATEKEAIEIMGMMGRSGLATTGTQMASLATAAKTLGASSGFTPQDMLQIAYSGGEIARQRGASQYEGGFEAMKLTAQIKTGYGIFYDPTIVNKVGGAQNAAILMQNMAGYLGQTSIGKMAINGLMAGLPATTGPNTIYSLYKASAEMLPTTPGEAIDYQINQRIYRRNVDFETMSNSMSPVIFDIMRRGGIEEISQGRVEQFLINYGMSEEEASLLSSNMMISPDVKLQQEFNTAAGQYAQERGESLNFKTYRKNRRNENIKRWFGELTELDEVGEGYVKRRDLRKETRVYNKELRRSGRRGIMPNFDSELKQDSLSRIFTAEYDPTINYGDLPTTIEMLRGGKRTINQSIKMENIAEALVEAGISEEEAYKVSYSDLATIAETGQYHGQNLDTEQYFKLKRMVTRAKVQTGDDIELISKTYRENREQTIRNLTRRATSFKKSPWIYGTILNDYKKQVVQLPENIRGTDNETVALTQKYLEAGSTSGKALSAFMADLSEKQLDVLIGEAERTPVLKDNIAYLRAVKNSGLIGNLRKSGAEYKALLAQEGETVFKESDFDARAKQRIETLSGQNKQTIYSMLAVSPNLTSKQLLNLIQTVERSGEDAGIKYLGQVEKKEKETKDAPVGPAINNPDEAIIGIHEMLKKYLEGPKTTDSNSKTAKKRGSI